MAPTAVVGVALGFGAQRLVQDLLAGFFIIAERQYGFGDLITIAIPGIPGGVIGTVEDVTLRVTKVRTPNGEVIITPNGQIVQLTNLSRDWARAVVEVPFPLGVDVGHASEILRQVGREVFADEVLKPQLLDAPAVMGVESIEVDQIHVRVVARPLPGRQFMVGRALRGRFSPPAPVQSGSSGGTPVTETTTRTPSRQPTATPTTTSPNTVPKSSVPTTRPTTPPTSPATTAPPSGSPSSSGTPSTSAPSSPAPGPT